MAGQQYHKFPELIPTKAYCHCPRVNPERLLEMQMSKQIAISQQSLWLPTCWDLVLLTFSDLNQLVENQELSIAERRPTVQLEKRKKLNNLA